MNTRCQCGRADSEDWTPNQCRVCWLYRYRPKYRDVLSGKPVPPPKPPPPACIHRGDELTISEIQSLNLNPRKRWHTCERPGFDREGQPVNGCTGCNAKCKGYEIEITPSNP